MLSGIVNRLQGQVRLRVESAFPERILNLCAERKLGLWDVRWESATVFSCTLTRRDWKVLRLLSRKLACTLTVEKKEGAPFFVGRLRRRYALLVCLAVCSLGMVFGSFFIWDITVDGAHTVPEEAILRALEKNGVGFGTFGFSINGEDLRNHILLDIPELSWISVNVSGCRAYVQVRERVPAPVLDDRRTPSNVVARRAGLVLNIQAYIGSKCVLKGDTVEEGQILISGVEDTDTFGARMTAGMGKVTARTWYALSADFPLTAVVKTAAEDDQTRYAVIFGKQRIKFYGNSSYFGATYDKITTRQRLAVFDLPLPITVEKETYRFYTPTEVSRSAPEVEAEGKAVLTAYLEALMGGEGEIRSTLCSSRQNGDTLTVTLTAECVEEIGETVPIEAAEDTGRIPPA